MQIERLPEFHAWLGSLRDLRAIARIAKRIDMLALGNPGDVAPVGEGVSELRIDYGPGYRVYFVQGGPDLSVMLWGGDKSTQTRDIAKAKRLAGAWSRARAANRGRVTEPECTVYATGEISMGRTTTSRYDSADYLKSEEAVRAYLEECFAENDPALIAHALGVAARARGMTQVSRDTGLTREGLYKALDENGNPSLATVLKVTRALGYKLSLTPG